MKIRPFRLERYFAEHEFSARHLLSASDCESLALPELLNLADRETSELWENLWLGYTESPGNPLLREEISGHYSAITARNVLVAAPEEAIFIAMQALLSPEDEVIVTWPAYQSLSEIAESIGCKVTRWPLRWEGGVWRLDTDLLADLVTSRTRLIVANFPHNPTGYLPAQDEWHHVIDITRRNGIYLFSDEMYRLLEGDDAARLPPACDLYGRGITLSGVSKSYGLPGLRIGWLATPDADLLARCQAIKDYTTICASAPSEILALIALRARELIVARNRRIVADNAKIAADFFAKRAGHFEWAPPAAGPVAFPRLTTGEKVSDWCARVLAERQVMIVPGEMFDFEGNHFRLGLGRKNFPRALAALGEG